MNCKVMGIVNVTPDSFSDGGKFFSPEEAVRRAANHIDEGADILDFGGESTRPGATPLAWDEEWARLEPVLGEVRGLKGKGRRKRGEGKREKEEGRSAGRSAEIQISVDTYHPETAARAIEAGATIVNCVYAQPIPDMIKLLDVYPDVELVLPVRGEADLAPYRAYLPRLYLDPMIGFDTTREEDLRLLQATSELAKLGRVLVGASRKRIVKKLTGTKVPGKDLAGNLAIALWAAQNGASVVRVHDVRETVQALKVWGALSETVA